MKRQTASTVLAFVLMSFIPFLAWAAQSLGQQPLSHWHAASSEEQLAYANTLVSLCKPVKCTAVDIKKCMDASLGPSATPSVASMSIADAATACVSHIESAQSVPN
jgi:hypothetical protein